MGKDNCFYNLTAFCQQTAGESPVTPVTSWDDFKDRFAQDGETDDSRVLDTAPWGDRDPLQQLQNALLGHAFRRDQLAQVFQLKTPPSGPAGNTE